MQKRVKILSLIVLVSACGSGEGSLEGKQYALMKFVLQGQVAQVEQLLNDPALLDVNWQSRGIGPTALANAVAAQQPEIVELLLAKNADPNRSEESGFTPLHSASASGNLPILQMLIHAGANVDAIDRPYGYSPLAYAVSRGHVDAALALLQAGANPNLAINDGRTIEQLAIGSSHPEIASAIHAVASR